MKSEGLAMADSERRHIPLAQKYRPMTFADVVGQSHVTRTLKHALEMDRVANAYLFIGPRGIGKTTLSRIFAKALNCTNPQNHEPCGECENCRAITIGNSLDVTELDGASHNKVEDVKPIIEAVDFPPVSSRYRVFIIDECHMLSTAAWNALLKTLEEPPPYVKFIFATTEGDKMLATIVSRCQCFDLRRIQTNEIVSRLKHICSIEKVDATDDALLAIARGAEGGMRDALSALDQLISFKEDGKITEEDILNIFGLVSRSLRGFFLVLFLLLEVGQDHAQCGEHRGNGAQQVHQSPCNRRRQRHFLFLDLFKHSLRGLLLVEDGLDLPVPEAPFMCAVPVKIGRDIEPAQ